ncbi:MAG: T9SS type A sorting domain-containing protein [Cytophagaceae bacterium]
MNRLQPKLIKFNLRNLSFLVKIFALFLLLFLSFVIRSNAQVDITAPAANVYPCSTYPTAYTNLGNIVITETSNTAFGNGSPQANVTFRLYLSNPNFQFQPGVGTVTRTSAGGNVTLHATTPITVTATTITIMFSNCAGGGCGGAIDQLTISGIRVRSSAAGTSEIWRGGGDASLPASDPGTWGGNAIVNGAAVGGLPFGSITAGPFPSANAGIDQMVCSSTASMAASPNFDPNVTGTWTLVSGGGTISSPNSNTSNITGMPLGDNVFRWTLSNGTCTSSSIVTITSMASGMGCTVASNSFSAVTAISPAYSSQHITCPPPSAPADITTFTLANPGPFNVGDKVLVIQMTGAVANTAAAAIETGGANDNVFGQVTDYNGAGNYEYAIIASKVGSNVTFSQNLLNRYNVAGNVQLVTVPQFANYTLSATLQGTPWNGTTGGVFVMEVLGTLTINGGTISMDSRGFRGGGNVAVPGTPLSGAALNCQVWEDASTNPKCGMGRYSAATCTRSTALRGEGIALSSSHLYGRGALANGGGSGGGWNSGGGGGSNICTGGRGGYEYSSCYNTGTAPYFVGYDPIYNTGIGSVASGQVARMHGIGGYALSATPNRIFMGGGGGAGNGDGSAATPGGNGGGIILITAQTIAGTGGTITANGQDGYRNNLAPYSSTVDATGGGGAGGSIILDVGTYSITSLTVTANGGKGGDNYQDATCHGNGGGGSGGFIRSKGLSPNVSIAAAGGDESRVAPDKTTGNCRNTPYGATAGTTCTGSAQVAAVVVPEKGCCSPANLGPDQTICGAAFISLANGTASNTNKVFRWYRNGVLIPGATGATYNATTSGVYSVQVDSTNAAGTFTFCTVTDAVIITNSFPTPFLGPNQTLCSPSYLNLVPTNLASFPSGTTWSWIKDGAAVPGANTAYLNNATAGTYTVTASTGVSGCGPTSATITLTSGTPNVTGACIPSSGPVTVSASGGNGGPYQWFTAQTDGSLLHTGSSYSTSISTTTTFWVQDNATTNAVWGALESQATGSPINSGGAGAGNYAQVFTVLQTVTLNAVKINMSSAGASATLTVNVRNSGGTIVGTRTITQTTVANGFYRVAFSPAIVLAPGTYTIDPVGTSVAPGSRNLSAITGISSYPVFGSDIALGNMVRFDRTNHPTAGSQTTTWGAFYEYEFSYTKQCDRVPVVAEVNGPSCPLPVTIFHFSAEKRHTEVLLEWATSREINNHHFLVQKSVNGKDFETIGKVNGKGTSNTVNRYFFTDEELSDGMIYYRLAQVDFDGTSTLSNVVVLNNERKARITLFPNPFENSTNVSISSAAESKVTIRVYDLTGKVLESVQGDFINKTVSVGQSLISGTYIVEVHTEYEIKTFRIIKSND